MEAQRVTHTIEPVFDARSRVLVLGTMPSPASRAAGFYYGHPQNRFWRVMERLFGLPDRALSENGPRTAFLLEHGIALWDVLASCSIAGASDASIADPVPNDLARILDAAPIGRVFTTGGTAARLCRRFDGELLAQRGIELCALPSTSPANARMRLDDLVEAYQPVAEAVRGAHAARPEAAGSGRAGSGASGAAGKAAADGLTGDGVSEAAGKAAKSELRRIVLARREAIPARERAERSRELCRGLERELDTLPVRPTISVYAAMGPEVDLAAFVDAVYRRGARVAFPCMERCPDTAGGRRQRMVMRLVAEDDLRTGSVAFVERPVASSSPDPERFPVVAPSEIDLALIPLVAFDAAGRRLGYGGGNYDRYLPLLRPDCRIAGVAFAEQRVGSVPVEAHDRTLPRIVVC